jgi:hypothetical protein
MDSQDEGLNMSPTPNVIEITWYGPFSWCGNTFQSVFRAEVCHFSGIYLWTIPFGNGFLTYYVGETSKTFFARLTDHVREYLTGAYRIYDPEAFAKGQKKLLWHGSLLPEFSDSFLDFLEEYPNLAPQLYNFLGKMAIFLGPLQANLRTRMRIKRAIVRTLQNQPEPVSFFRDLEIWDYGKEEGGQPIQVKFHGDAIILGLTSELEA